MAYIGNTPAEAYTSIDKQDITGNGGASYTLDHPVANENEIEVFVNNVRQEPSVAYTVSGTALNMTGNVEASDDFYVVFQGKAIQTTSHPEGQDLKARDGTFSGNVGIGTASPSETLQITGGLTAENSLVRIGGTAAFNTLLVGYSGTGDVSDDAPAIYATNTTGSTGQAGHIAYKSRSNAGRAHIFYTGSPTPTERLRIHEGGIVDILGGTIELNGNQITGVQVTIADDAFATITPTGRYGGYISVVASGQQTYPQHPYSAFLFADFGSSPLSSLVNKGGNFEVSTGSTTGTTGTDGKVTLFTGGTSGTFYLENRSGTSRSFQITLM